MPRKDDETKAGIAAGLDRALFTAGGVVSLWLAYLTLQEGIQPGWPMLLVVVFWAMVTYLVLPRIHRILTRIYVPDYFIGRTRTADGLLGDPVNLAMLGGAEHIHAAMRAAGWSLADELSFRTGWRIVMSSLTRRTYRTAPVSPLFLFQRRQDFAYQQEVAGNPNQRHHVRFWRCPDDWLLPGGTRVDWVAAGTYDRSVGLSLFTFQITHKIAEDVDVERDHIVESLRLVDPAVRLRVIEGFGAGYHSRNGGGDLIRTDGDLPIVDLSGLAFAQAGTPALPPTPRATPPLQVLFALGVTAIRGLVYLLLACFAFWGASPALVAEVDAELAPLLPIVGFGLAGLAVVDLGLGAFLFTRHNWARMTLCCLSLANAAVVFASRTMTNDHGRLGGDLAGLGLSVLVLLALSSEAAREYTHPRPRPGFSRRSARPRQLGRARDDQYGEPGEPPTTPADAEQAVLRRRRDG
ncbi:LssY C-terminal domain-containing protein [Micropruina sp.]|uniref:LssY C-terminal domain-containing protein n=1 Tax=Micropruina sp. TaxID=2737536 RepID=UPI0039E2ED5C